MQFNAPIYAIIFSDSTATTDLTTFRFQVGVFYFTVYRSFITSLVSYRSLIWMFHDRATNF